MTGIIKRSFQDLEKDRYLLLYKIMVESEWESIQTETYNCNWKSPKRATRLLKGFRLLSYKERLRRLELATLVYRRLRGDMIEYYDKDVKFHLQLNSYHRTREHNKRLYKPAVGGERRRQFFRQRVIDHWNSLTDDVVNAPSLATVEKRLAAFWSNLSIKYDYKAET